MVSFASINPTWKLPGVSIEVDPSQAGTPVNPRWLVLHGIKLAAGQAPADRLIAVGTQADADRLAGQGSMLARMFKVAFAINRGTPIFFLPVAEPSAGVKATGTITVAAAPTVAGTIPLYIAGQKLQVLVGSSDTTAQVATKIANAINATGDLPVTAAAASAVVTLTAKWKGLSGNDIRVEDSYRGFYGGELLPAGLSLTYPTDNVLSGGTGTPDLTSAIANYGDGPHKFLALPFNDSGSFSLWDTEFGFSDSGRWGWVRQSYGQVWSVKRDSYANLFAYGPTNNSAVISPLALEPTSPTPTWEWTAAYAARAAGALSADPARPLQTLTLDGCLPAPQSGRFSKAQLNGLAQVGLAIQGTDLDGTSAGIPQILREQTSYQRNASGQADNSYEVATTLSTLDEVLTRIRQGLSTKFGRVKLTSNGTRFGAGQAIVTPLIIKAEIVAIYEGLEIDGIVENTTLFKNYLVVERSSTNPDTVEVLLPPDIVNGLRRLNVKAQFRLQFPSSLAA
ncbi:phage tail sheath C-terminal domain-containing protein [Methylobacterium soli]|uniref:Phage tail protein n=1 Tax=Methylobacterium soli TaxID=553447 RepID=A0A6L3SZ73_9HYPH|nr:phage tail sheath C-terminal domain-containing protein [Methylobacterium soli]KAB1079421.1 phage tail protein [Methylobacterium soli]GJE45364.1 hypothetical protein AEGHOMDF_4558 [Methylobacterium soli]